jgi:hypothetical protein
MTEADELEPRGGSRWQWAAGAVAVLLAVAIVAGLLFVRHHFIRQGTPGAFFMELWAVDPSGHGGAHRVVPNSAQPAAGPSEVVPAPLQAGT